METALPPTARHYRGVRPSTSMGPSFLDLYTSWCQRKALKIVKDSSHPSHRLFSLLPHGKQYRSATSRSKRLLNSFYPPSHDTPEQLIRWLPRLYACLLPLFYAAATLCLLSGHSHFINSTIVTLTIYPCTYYLNQAD
jgi:hypothetical protein